MSPLTRTLESLSDSDNALASFLFGLLLAYVQVLKGEKSVEETELAPYYAMAGEHKLSPSSWDTRHDLMERRAMDNRAQTNLPQLFIGVLIAAIIGIKVFIPVVNDAVNSSNASGTTKTILGLLSLFAALLLLLALASPLMRQA